jgi:predicted small lipoprotein YifL
MKKSAALLLLALALATTVAACGNKGPLVRPEPDAPTGS